MSRKTSIIPKAPMARMLMKVGAKRVSASAVDTFSEVITEITEDIANKSVMIAKHSGRKTVKDGDIKIASK